MALTAACQEALWLQKLIQEVCPIHDKEAIKLLCDNKGAIDLSTTSEYKLRTKHIDTKHHFIREKIEAEEVAVKHVPTNNTRNNTC